MATGERAEEVVESIAGVTEQYIEAHEDSAKLFAILSYILGGISILGLWSSIKSLAYSKAINYITLVSAIVVLFFDKQVATIGGEIRHAEIRSGYVSPAADMNIERDDD